MTIVYLFICMICVSWLLSAFTSSKHFLALDTNPTNHMRTLFFFIPPLIMGFYFIALKPFEAGGDTARYLISFAQINNPFTATTDAGYGTEFLFWPIQAVLKSFLDPREWLIAHFVIVSALNYFAYKSISRGTAINPWLFALLYITYFAVYDANAMRQAYAVPLGVIAFSYCCQRDHLKFLAYSLLAISFHWSALIILTSPFFARIPARSIFYFAIPLGFLLAAPILALVIDFIIEITGFSWLQSKSEAYIKGEYTSHLTSIWLSINFWASVLAYTCLAITKLFWEEKHHNIAKISLMFICIMLITSNYVDISDRYMVNFMFIMPLVVVSTLTKIKINNFSKNILLITAFIAIATLVYTRETFISAMGIN